VASSYRILLDKYEPEQVVAAIQSMVDGGRQYRPMPGEVVAAIRHDPTMPTWPEAYRDVMRALRVHTPYQASDGEKEAIAVGWLREHSHELVAAFFRAQTYAVLSMLPLNDQDDDGKFAVKRLREDWEAFVERADDRIAQGLPLDQGTARKQLGPRKPDFAAALPEGPST
jgi:hypothetical protein